MGRVWSNEEVEYLKNNYSTKGSRQCSIDLHRTKQAIEKRASMLSLTNIKDKTIICVCGAERVISYKNQTTYLCVECQKNKDILGQRKYMKLFKKVYPEKVRKYRKKYHNQLPDGDVRRHIRRLYGISDESITKEFIDVVRERILMKRTLKEVKEHEPDRSNVQGEQRKDEENHDGTIQIGGNSRRTA